MLAALLSLAIALIIPAAGYVVLLAALAAVLGFVPSALGSHERPQAIARRRGLRRAVSRPHRLQFTAAAAAAALPCARSARLGHRHGYAVRDGRFLLPLLGNATRPVRQRLSLDCRSHDFRRDLHHGAAADLLQSWPQRVNIEYWVDADSGRAHWYTQTASLHLPRAMGETLKFDPMPRERFPGYPLEGILRGGARLEVGRAGADANLRELRHREIQAAWSC